MNPRLIVFATSSPDDTPFQHWSIKHKIDCLFLSNPENYDQHKILGPTLRLDPEQSTHFLKDELVSFRPIGVFARNERDVIPAAGVRSDLKLSGQELESAKLYRNKALMKIATSLAGIRTPRFCMIPAGVEAEVPSFDFPIVVKPVDGSGSVGVCVVSEKSDFLAVHSSPKPFDRLVEQFVAGPVAHFDGVVKNGEILFGVASQYINDCLSYREGQSCGSRLLNPCSPLSKALAESTKRVLGCLPSQGIHPFHAEFFADPKGGAPIFCEIASRTPGGRIKQMIFAGTGIDLDEVAFVGAAGLSVDGLISGAWEVKACGFMLFYSHRGTLVKLPDLSDFNDLNSIVRYDKQAKFGETFSGPDRSGRGIASIVFNSPSFLATEKLGLELADCFQKSCLWKGN